MYSAQFEANETNLTIKDNDESSQIASELMAPPAYPIENNGQTNIAFISTECKKLLF
jgi:hypothetical protein